MLAEWPLVNLSESGFIPVHVNNKIHADANLRESIAMHWFGNIKKGMQMTTVFHLRVLWVSISGIFFSSFLFDLIGK